MTTETIATKPATFEFETCTRCGGSGHFSRCERYGTMCFRCHGRKRTLTARGAAAKAFYEASCSKPLRDVAVGDIVWENSFFGAPKWAAVTEIRPDTMVGTSFVNGVEIPRRTDLLVLVTEGLSMHGLEPESPVRVRQSPEERAVKLAAALAYEATLTAKGTPRKRAARPTAAA